MGNLVKLMLLVTALSIVSSIGACNYISGARNAAYKAVQIGDAEAAVIERFGQPSVRETPELLFSRYASAPCKCTERLWFENRLSLDTEAWSVELDSRRQVQGKTRWVSP